MNKKNVRSTVNFPLEMHRQLRLEAIREGVSFSNLILQRIQGSKKTSLEDDLKFFARLRSKGPQFDASQAIRAERDSH